jgi:hypothetical protein
VALVAAAIAAGVASATAAAVPAAAPNPFFGVTGVRAPTQAELDRAARAGAGTFRMQIAWTFLEPAPGVRDYRALDLLVEQAALAGVTVLPDLNGVPSWVSRKPTRPPIHSARQRAAWRAFVADLAARYGSSGSFWRAHPDVPRRPITTWEVWYRPNLHGLGRKASAKRYARLLAASAAGLRAGDPAARVLTAGLFPYRVGRGTAEMARFLTALYRVKRVKGDFDALGLAAYAPRPKRVLHWVRVARRIMRGHGDGATPISVTEFGWVTGGAGFRSSALRSTRRQQARRLAKTYRLLARHAGALGIESAIWFSYSDHDTPHRRDFWTDRGGLFTLNGTPKPAWYAFARVAGGTP